MSHHTPGMEPLVRIGMIRAADLVTFRLREPCTLYDASGEARTQLAAGTYQVSASAAVPAQIDYFVRLAIRDTKEEAQRAAVEYGEKGWPVTYRHAGLEVDLGATRVDNREYWVLAGPFANEHDAVDFRRQHEIPAVYLVVEQAVRKPRATLHCAGQSFENTVRLVPPAGKKGVITLANVVVGVEFHWQHLEDQTLFGALEVTVNNQGKLVAIDELLIEDYLASVNSSEMTVDCPPDLLRAQTVAARATVLATMGKHHAAEPFHLCADDHCQRYWGAGYVMEQSRAAAAATRGEVLMFRGKVCDARYSKICGGVAEDYANVWDERRVPYLVPFTDGRTAIPFPIDDEDKARAFIDSNPDVFCNTQRYPVPDSLGDSNRLFRWQVCYSREELQELIARKTGIEFGELVDLVPGARGASGRLMSMQVVGSRGTFVVGKELEIRRILSESHLYSACFYIERERDAQGRVRRFVLHGAGWGHGVGLCQVGATTMAAQGYDYRQILAHYYPGTELVKLY
ncbi:MAG: SpoIID/LytB domain-containing protein [candidate division KSB1 bacterium]|nr:SpoIID/LytB domain-containing protein [candidate division KSB1 bacterium]